MKRILYCFLTVLLSIGSAYGAAGDLRWSVDLGSDIDSTPAVSENGTIYVTTRSDGLIALSSGGAELWRFDDGSYIYSASPVIGPDGTIYFGNDGSKLYAINPDGTQKWVLDVAGDIISAPALSSDGVLYVGDEASYFYAVDSATGQQLWSYRASGDYSGSPAIASDGTIYAASEDSLVYAFNPDGTVKWTYDSSSYFTAAPAIGTDGTVYVGGYDDNFYALNPDGSVKWSYAAGGNFTVGAAIAPDGSIYVGNDDYNIYAFDSSGALKWVFATGYTVRSTPVVDADGTVYVGSRDNMFYAINPDGTLKWSFANSYYDYDGSATIVSDGTLYVGNDSDDLLAFETGSSLATSVWPKAHGNVNNTGLFGDVANQQTASLLASISSISSSGQCPDMSMVVSVTDSSRNNITGLTQGNFTLNVNGQPVSINDVSLLSDSLSTVLNVAFTMDYSGSMSSTDISDMETAASQFISLMQAGDQASIIKFGSDVDVTQPFTSDLNAAALAATADYSGGGSTSLYDSVYLALANVAGQAGQQVVVAMSDGSDNDSSYTFDDVVAYANQLGIAVYTVTLGSGDQQTMTQLAARTGGQSYYSPDSTQLQQIYQSIATSIQSQYVVTFTDPTEGLTGNVAELRVDTEDNHGITTATYDSCKDYTTGINQIVEFQCPVLEAVVTIYDQDGQPLNGLGINSFDLFLDGAGATINSVEQVQSGTSKTTFALVMDYSVSMSSQDVLDMEEAAKLIVANKMADDEGVVVKFSDSVVVSQSLTNDAAALNTAIDAEFGSRGSTSLFDAIDVAISELSSVVGRKAIIVLSDGEDTTSSETLSTVTTSANQADVPLFTVGLGGADAVTLQALADATFGIYYYAPDGTELAQIYTTLSDILQSQYLIKFNDIFADALAHTAVINTVVRGKVISSDQRNFISCAPPSSQNIDFETGAIGNIAYTNGGNLPWEVSDYLPITGTYSLMAPQALANSQSSSFTVTATTSAGDMTFNYKVSSEGSFDYLNFYVDGNLVDRWSGSVTATQFSYTVTAGEHQFTWEYDKDGSVSSGDDVAWIDDIVFPGVSTSTDSDQDGYPDSNDAFPQDPTEWFDTDNDGIGNNADTDDDGDGYLDTVDAFPTNPSEWLDTDGDGIGNNADDDDDGDGIIDILDATPLGYVAANDVDGDGKSDLLWRSYTKGWNFLWTMDGTATATTIPINVVPGTAWDMVGQGDYDADGKSDIFWRNNVTGQNFIYLMEGAVYKSRYTLNYVGATDWRVAGSGDFDGDGTGDVLWRNINRGDTWFYLMDAGLIRDSLPSLAVNDLNYEIAATGDVDGDGDDDVIWRNSASGINYIWLMQGGSIASRYTLNTVNTEWDIAGAGDLDGDGTDDIILRNQVSGENWVYFMENGQIRESTLINTVADTNWQIANMGDYDGDGKADFLWRHAADARNIIHLMDGTTRKASGVLKNTDDTWRVAQ